jgi:hypothetical protein
MTVDQENSSESATKVFMSYSHDSQAHADAVLRLSDGLRADGIDCHIDQYEESPPEGWPRWMERQIRESQFVLVVCSEFYLKKILGQVSASEGLGVRWEGSLVYQHLYNAAASNVKFIPILLTEARPEHIPTPLQGATYYRPGKPDDFERLSRRLRGIQLKGPPPLGKPKPVAPKERKTNPGLFLTGFTEPSLWNEAQWLGVFFVSDPAHPPWFGLAFKNEQPARKIFEQWQERLGRNDVFEELRVSVIEGEIEGERPGYTVYISANVENILKRAESLGLNLPNEYFAIIGRKHRMNPQKGSRNLQGFKDDLGQFGCYQLCPAIVEGSGVRLLAGYGLLKKEVVFRNINEIASYDDPDAVVLKKSANQSQNHSG